MPARLLEVPMFHPFRALDARTAAEETRMLAAGYQVERTGRWARAYRLDPDYLAARQAEAERERIAQMGRNAMELHALAFPRQHADMLARRAAIEPAPAGAAPLELDRLAAALAERMNADRVTFERERLTIERGRQS
jgi:hypothetical protein